MRSGGSGVPALRTAVMSRAVGGLDHHNVALVLPGKRICSRLSVSRVPFQMLAPHADLVTDQFVAKFERVEPVGTDGPVSQSHHRAAQNGFEFVLKLVEVV